MKIPSFGLSFISGFMMFATHTVQAGIAVWSFTPLTPTHINVPKNGIATIQYQITNQSSRPHSLVMNPIPGVSQMTSGSGNCGNPLALAGHSSCILSLQIDGSQFQTTASNEIVLCEQNHQLECYRPGSGDGLTVQITPNQYSVSGKLTNLVGTVYLQNNNSNALTLNGDGLFTFTNGLSDGAAYEVTVESHPDGQICSVAHGSGIIHGADVTNVQVTCDTHAYPVSGNVSGLTGTLVLLNNELDATTITQNGTFVFATTIADGSPYEVTVASQPDGQTCNLINNSGTINGENVSNITVICTRNLTTITSSVTHLALQTHGKPRTITITNTGSNTAENLSISYPTWPLDSLAISNCGNSLPANEQCKISVMPGPEPTSHCNAGTGSAAVPGRITVTASNLTAPATTDVEILTYGCIYQQGYLFAIDDDTPASSSIGGQIAALSNNSEAMQWSNGSFVTTNAQSLSDGAANTHTIISVQGAGNYAAQLCADFTIDSTGNSPCATGICYTNWYLPAICQMGAAGQGAGCSNTPNMTTNLPALIAADCSGSQCLSNFYWSSTEYAATPQFGAWDENFGSNGNSQYGGNKDGHSSIRCARDLTF